MARKRKRTITMKRNRKGTYTAPSPRRKSRSTGRKSFMGADFQGIAFAGVGYGILSRIVRSVIGGIPSLANMGNLIFPMVVLFVNNRFFGNQYISVLAINELTQQILRQTIPALNVNGTDEDFLLAGDTIDEPYAISGDTIDEPYAISGDDDLGEYDDTELSGTVGMTSPKEFTI